MLPHRLIFIPLAFVASQSVYTSIRVTDCRTPKVELAAPYRARDLGVQQCPAPAGWRLLVVASDANSWLDVRSDTVAWSSEDAIVYEAPIGLFPGAARAGRVEWRRRADGQMTALIFRVTAQVESGPARQLSMLFVARLERDRACLIGRVRSNEEARALADGPARCAPNPPSPAGIPPTPQAG